MTCPKGLVGRRLPALEGGRLPIRPDRLRPLDPGTEFGLGKFRVLSLELDPVRVAGLEMFDEHLAGDLALAPLRNGEVDANERVRVAVEDGRCSLLLEQFDVLEPVDVLSGRGGEQVDVLDLGDVLLVGEAPPREVLGVDLDDLLRLFGHRSSPTYSGGCSGR